MLAKVQRDQDSNGRFSLQDHEYYYVSFNLKTLKRGNRMELKELQ